jgi:hypothetical protein
MQEKHQQEQWLTRGKFAVVRPDSCARGVLDAELRTSWTPAISTDGVKIQVARLL